MAQINPLDLSRAIAEGDGIYELILTNWGNRGQAQEPNNGSISYPPIKSNTDGSIPIIGQFLVPRPTGAFALAIAPRSDVDRCIINYTSQPQANPLITDPIATAAFANQGGILETEQILSIHSPLIGQQPGPLLIRAYPSRYFTDTYLQANAGTQAPFGTAAGQYLGGVPFPPDLKTVFVPPQLRILMYLTSKGALPPTRRAPGFWAFDEDATGLNAEKLVRILPIMGRSQVTVSVYCTTGPINVRVGGTYYFQLGNTGGSRQDYEVELYPSTTIAGGASVNLTICSSDTPSSLSFMTIYMEPNPPGGGANAVFSVQATDG